MTHTHSTSAGATRAAAALLGAEAIALACVAVWQVIELFAAESMSIATAIALIVMTIAAAAGLAAFALGVLGGRSWGRSGGIVAQVLIVAVAVGSVTGPYPHWGIAALLAVPAVLTFVLLLAAAKRRPDEGVAER